MRFIKEHKRSLYLELLMTGKLNSSLVDIDRQEEDMLLRVMEGMAKNEGVSVQLKAEKR